MTDIWQAIATRKQEERASRIPKSWILPTEANKDSLNVLNVPHDCGILTKEELRLTQDFDATALLHGLLSGLLKSVDVVTAFCKRSAIAQQLTNCLTEIFYEDALARARELDDFFAKEGRPFGPLHGLPISLKDSFKVSGYDASLGVAALCFSPATTNSALVDLLLAQGAVLYCKTNVPLTLMALDSHNNVFGRTMNPVNRSLTAGGSSGGEGALIAMRGSILGIGTDIGGSIRVPAFCDGIYGIKPSHGRVPYVGQENAAKPGSNKLAIESTAGPIATSVRDCELLLQIVCDSNPAALDPDTFSQTWDQQASLTAFSSPSERKPLLRVGMVRTDGHVTPLPPIQRFMEEIAQKLLGRGSEIEVIEVDITSLGPQCLKVFNTIVSIDGANNWFDLLEKTGEPLSPWMQTRLRRRPQKALDEVRKAHGDRTELLTAFLDVWREGGGHWNTSDSKMKKGERTLDVIICPPAPHPVAPVDRWNTANYTSVFNILDYPAGIIPVRSFEEADLQGEILDSKPLNGWDKINRGLWTDVDRKVYLGSSLSLQVVAPRLMERKLVESMAILDEILKATWGGSSRSSKL